MSKRHLADWNDGRLRDCSLQGDHLKCFVLFYFLGVSLYFFFCTLKSSALTRTNLMHVSDAIVSKFTVTVGFTSLQFSLLKCSIKPTRVASCELGRGGA